MADDSKPRFPWMWLVLFFISVVVWNWPSNEVNKSGSNKRYVYRVVNYNTFACKDRTDLERIGSVWGDREKLNIAMRRCSVFDKEELVIVEEYSASLGMYLARRPDNPQTYWFYKRAIDKREVPNSDP